MTEQEYIVAMNLAKARAAKQLIADILPGWPEYGIYSESWRAVNGALQDWCQSLEAIVNVDHTG